MSHEIAFPLTLTNEYMASPYAIWDARGDVVAYLPPSNPHRKEHGKFLVAAGNAHPLFLASIAEAQALLVQWSTISPGQFDHAILSSLMRTLGGKTLFDVVRDAQKGAQP
jgi:hypothetical protein